MQHLWRAVGHDLCLLHEGHLSESFVRKVQPLQRLLPLRAAADAGIIFPLDSVLEYGV